ncbi:hypothetical protein [uncultured Kordia sp.]|uniref:hypothetical protein n=1 Tax=uncultured Kordia sp. TaxID=507699 RepID=UPI00261DDC99|nr:hypothetical protein [uncultured Kordia sp.]
MKKQKLNFKKLSLQKKTIANIGDVQGGAPRSLGCPAGTSVLLNCTTTQNPTRPLVTVDPHNEICITIFNSCKSYCPFC